MTEKNVKQIIVLVRAATYPPLDWRAPECAKIRKANCTCCYIPSITRISPDLGFSHFSLSREVSSLKSESDLKASIMVRFYFLNYVWKA
jgi:hypothetical protein